MEDDIKVTPLSHFWGCKCDACSKIIEELEKTTISAIERYGFAIHAVFGDLSTPYNINIHTHGLEESYGHIDLQICVPITQDVAHVILSKMIDNIKDGKKYEAGHDYDGIMKDGMVKMAFAEEGGRVVLRLIFPDRDGKFNGALKDQLNNTLSLS